MYSLEVVTSVVRVVTAQVTVRSTLTFDTFAYVLEQ